MPIPCWNLFPAYQRRVGQRHRVPLTLEGWRYRWWRGWDFSTWVDETPKFIALLKVKRRKSEKKKKSSFKVCRQCVDPSPKKNTGHRCVFDDPLIQWDHPPGRTKIATRLILGSVYSLNPSFCYFQTENDESKMTTKSMQQLPRGSVFSSRKKTWDT